MDYYREHNIEIKIVRIFNTYGPNMAKDDGRVISNFIYQALNNKDITINGDGSQTRSFQFIDDLVKGMICMMETDNSIIGPINIGNPEEISIIDVAKKVILLTKSNSKIKFEILPVDDPKKRKPDIKLAKNILNWSPKYNLNEGLKNTIDFFISNYI